MEPTKATFSTRSAQQDGAGQAGPGGDAATPGAHLAAESNTEKPQVRTVFDPRLPCERQKSRKFNRTSSYQCLVEMEGWLKAFPDLTIDDLGPGFSSSSFENSQGLNIATYAWKQSQTPKAAIVLFHSYTSYTLFDFLRHQPQNDTRAKEEDETWVQKYAGKTPVQATSFGLLPGRMRGASSVRCAHSGSWVEGFFNLGMNVYAMDHQSHGRSEGWKQWRCNVAKFDCFVSDALQFLNEVVLNDPELPPDVPIVLLGYSMGGNVVIQTLGKIYSEEKEITLRRRVSHAVLLAPLIKIKLDRKTKILLMINRSLISCCLPNLRFSREDTSGDCPYLGWWYNKDPFTYSGAASRSLANSPVDSCSLV
ncbi:hypothetical protein Emag_005861 [Eimeria magna]